MMRTGAHIRHLCMHEFSFLRGLTPTGCSNSFVYLPSGHRNIKYSRGITNNLTRVVRCDVVLIPLYSIYTPRFSTYRKG